MQKIHEMPWEDRAAVVDQLEDDRLQEFGNRLIYFDHTEALPAAKRAELDDWRARRVLALVPCDDQFHRQFDAVPIIEKNWIDQEMSLMVGLALGASIKVSSVMFGVGILVGFAAR